jgi:type VI protein secretion system component Hcp
LSNVTAIERDFVKLGTGLPHDSMAYVMLFNILHAEDAIGLLSEPRVDERGWVRTGFDCDLASPLPPWRPRAKADERSRLSDVAFLTLLVTARAVVTQFAFLMSQRRAWARNGASRSGNAYVKGGHINAIYPGNAMHTKARIHLFPYLPLCLLGAAGLLLTPAAQAQSAPARYALAQPALAQPALNTFMHIEGIPGESVVVGHENDIALTSYSQTFGTKNCSRVVAVKAIDRASPALISNAAANTLLPSVVISISKGLALGAGQARGAGDFFKATLQSVLIERVEVSDTTGTLVERVVLKPTAIQIEYRAQAPDGSMLPPVVTDIECM